MAGLSMDVLAQRAGVGKATIYRRWDSKEALILDALRMTATPIPAPDEGTVRDDLFAYMDAVIERFSPGRGSDVLPHLIEASCYDEQLRASLDDYLRGRQATIRLHPAPRHRARRARRPTPTSTSSPTSSWRRSSTATC